MKNLRPIGQQILLRFLKAEAPKPGDIYIGDRADQGPQKAIVIALGSGQGTDGKVIPFEVSINDVVLVSRMYPGVELKEDGENYCLVREEGLLGIVETA